MAYTRIHAIKATIHKSVKYICDPAKTDGEILVSSFACSPETARYDFEFELSKTSKSDKNLAFHLVQSFAPGEVSYEEAHRIGIELADRLLSGHHAYIVSTHTDGHHPHNHIIFCAADHITHRKYHDCKQSYKRIRALSDRLCEEHNLSVIIPGPNRGKSHKEWSAIKDGTSWKEQIRKDIDATIKLSKTYEIFLALMRAKGYEIKGETFGEGSHKYITFKAPGMQRSARGSAKSLGFEYTKERIKDRIELVNAKRVNIASRREQTSLIDTTQDKFQNSPGLKRWAEKQNLKIASKAYAEAGSIAALSEKIENKSAEAKEARATVVKLDHRLQNLSEIIRYVEQYTENRKYHLRYQKSANKERYYQEHEGNLLLYEGARNVLKRHGVNPKTVDPDKLRAEYDALQSQRDKLYKTYKSREKEVRNLKRRRDDLAKYLGMDQHPEIPSVQHNLKKSI